MPPATLRLPAALERLDDFRAFVVDEARRSAVPDAMLGKLELVLEELLVNVISYAYPEGGGEIEVACGLDGGSFALGIRDWGPAFDPLQAGTPDLDADVDDRPIGGLGIFFVKSMASEVTYAREGEANALRLRFDLPG